MKSLKNNAIVGRLIPTIHSVKLNDEVSNIIVDFSELMILEVRYEQMKHSLSDPNVLDKFPNRELPMDIVFSRMGEFVLNLDSQKDIDEYMKHLSSQLPEDDKERFIKQQQKVENAFLAGEGFVKEMNTYIQMDPYTDHSVYLRDHEWRFDILDAIESGRCPTIAIGAAHVVREPLFDGDMSIKDWLVEKGFEIKEVSIHDYLER